MAGWINQPGTTPIPTTATAQIPSASCVDGAREMGVFSSASSM